jgi:AcrR family transcriptional regulator
VAKAAASPSDRRTSILDAASATFIRYGYRKTSMDDVAREAEISRQALYAYFTDKETLFRESMQHGCDVALAAVDDTLADEAAHLDVRLVKAFDQWVGRHLERSGTDGSDLGEAGRVLLGSLFADRHAVFEKKIARAIASSPVGAANKEARVSCMQVAQTLGACAKGWKQRATSRAEFVEQMEIAVRLLCPKARVGR